MRREELSGKWKFKLDPENEGESEGYPKTEFDDSDWDDIEVPSYWINEGYDYNGPAWYRKKFEGARSEIANLVFEGVDYYADLWLNGEKICEHEGCFDDFSVDIADKIEEGENLLAIRVDAPKEEPTISLGPLGERFLPKSEQYLSKRQVKGVLSDWDCKTLDLVPGGLFKPVYLELSEGGAFEEVKVETRIESEKRAYVDLKIESRLVGKDIKLRGSLQGKDFESEKIEFDEEAKESVQRTLEVTEPRFWWTWDYGEPNLYELRLELVEGEEVLDEYTQNVGIRELEIRVDPTLKEQICDLIQYLNPPLPVPNIPWDKPDPDFWTAKLNGKRIYLRGSNYISSVFIGDVTEKQYEEDVRLMKEANLNFMRVHAHMENDEFYDICDEAGILLQQDFTLQWGYQATKQFEEVALNLITRMVKKLRNHPSIGLWTVHNEPMPWDYFGVDEKMKRRVEELDPKRPAVKGSGYPGWDGHEYPGWYIGKVEDFRKMSDLFPTEYGAQAFPNMETISNHVPEDKRWPLDYEWWKRHNWQPTVTFKHLPEPGSLEELIESTQEYQAFVIKVGTEHFRRLKFHNGKPYTGGTTHFMFTDCCFAVTWSVLDIDRRPKKGYFALKESMQPIIPSLRWYKYKVEAGEEIESEIYAINDTYDSYEDVLLKYQVKDPSENVLMEGEKRLDLAEYCSEPIEAMQISLPEDAEKGKYMIEMKFRVSGETLSENHFWFYVNKAI